MMSHLAAPLKYVAILTAAGLFFVRRLEDHRDTLIKFRIVTPILACMFIRWLYLAKGTHVFPNDVLLPVIGQALGNGRAMVLTLAEHVSILLRQTFRVDSIE